MRCTTCGAEMTTGRENYLYTASGLDGITLEAVEVRRCRECGAHSVLIPALSQLHRLIAQTLIQKPGVLTKEEVRFLRKHMGFSGKDFAEMVGAASETVSRWESGALPVPAQLDRLIRLMVATNDSKIDYSLEAFRHMTNDPRPLRLGLKAEQKGWTVAA